MMQLIVDHLWQSTLFVIAAGLLTLALRDNAAGVRYWVWFAASLKFLIPFSLLARAGERLGVVVSPPTEMPIAVFMMEIGSAPVPSAASTPIVTAIAAVWLIGCLGVLGAWARQYFHIAAIARAAQPSGIAAPLAVKFVRAKLEPGLLGIARPVLLMPEGIATSLTPAEMQSILAHEVSHFHRWDNLTAAVYMLV